LAPAATAHPDAVALKTIISSVPGVAATKSVNDVRSDEPTVTAPGNVERTKLIPQVSAAAWDNTPTLSLSTVPDA